MAEKEKKVLREKTFYLYDYAGNLALKAKKILDPYNVMIEWRVPWEDFIRRPEFAEFINGQCIIKEEELGKVKYEQRLEWLGFYNPVGWILSLWKGKGQELVNGDHKRNDGIHIVKSEIVEDEVEEATPETEFVEVAQIPSIIAKGMNVAQLKDLTKEWNIDLPENIMELGNEQVIKSKIIELLTEANHIN